MKKYLADTNDTNSISKQVSSNSGNGNNDHPLENPNEPDKFCQMINEIIIKQKEPGWFSKKQLNDIVSKYDIDIPDYLIDQFFIQAKLNFWGKLFTCEKARKAYEDYKRKSK